MARISERPPFIVAFAADMQGCGWARMQIPLGALMNTGLAEGRVDLNFWSVEQIVAVNPDVVVFQRSVETRVFELMQEYRKAVPNAFFVYEIDDFFAGLPPKSFWNNFVPSMIVDRIMQGISLCDAVTTTTEPLAAWLREHGAKDVRVMPNVVPMTRMRKREQRPDGAKLRVGWAGSISHEGDIEILRRAMEDIGEKVQWVFMGIQPESPPVRIEFQDGVPVNQYLDVLEKLDLDLMLAPLEENEFNRCKSNLKILESGLLDVPVIAQAITPYQDLEPPVFAHATTPEDWSIAIARFVETSRGERQKSAEALQRWTSRHFTIEGNLHKRLAAWTPVVAEEERFRPRATRKTMADVVVACAEKSDLRGMPGAFRNAPWRSTLEEGAREAIARGAHLLWLRPGTGLDPAGWRTLSGLLADSAPDGKTAPPAASLPVAPDGPNAFPKLSAFTPASERTGRAIAAALRAVVPARRMNVLLLGGPCVLFGRHALAHFGVPDVEGSGGNEEVAVLEWGFRAALKGWRLVQAADAYAWTLGGPIPATEQQVKRIQGRGYGPLLQIAAETFTPEERRDVELRLLRDAWGGPRPGLAGFGGDYAAWTLLREEDRRLRPALADNIAVAKFGGPIPDREWIVFVDDNVALRPHTAAVLSTACAKAGPEAVAVYADHDTMGLDGKPVPWFKPDFDYEMFLARDYVTPACAIRRSLLDGLMELQRPALDERLLQCAVQAEGEGQDLRGRFVHVPEILASGLDESPEMAGVRIAIRQDVVSRLLGTSVEVTPHRRVQGALSIIRIMSHGGLTEEPFVSVIVPTKGDGWLLEPCLNTLLGLTKYANLEVLLVMTGEGEPGLGAAMDDPRLRILRQPGPFNWSAINNVAVKEAKGSVLCFLNDDTRVAVPEWLRRMVAQAIRPTVGAVGARLIFPHGLVQHVGVVVHRGICVHVHKGMPIHLTGYRDVAALTHEASAVTGACMVVERTKFDAAGGFDEALSHNYNDVDFCMRLGKLGYRNVVEASIELLHMEGATRSTPTPTKEWLDRLRADNATVAQRFSGPDPYWNPNFALGMSGDGTGIFGGGYEILSWDDAVPAADAERVLYVNPIVSDPEIVADRRGGAVVSTADMGSFVMRLTAPKSENVGIWDMRQPEAIADCLRKLGIGRVVVRSLVGAAGPAPPVETLRSFAAMGIPVSLVPADPRLMAPWLDGEGDRRDIDAVFGRVDIRAWREASELLELARKDAPALEEAAD